MDLWIYASQSGRCLDEKQSFYDELKCEWDIHSADDLLMCLGDTLWGAWRVWYRSEEFGRMLSQFCLEKQLSV